MTNREFLFIIIFIKNCKRNGDYILNSNNYEDLNVIEKKGVFSAGRINSGIFSVLFIVIGFILAKNPESAIRTVCYAIGGVTLLFGIIKIFLYLKNKSNGFISFFDLTGGIISCAIGLFLLFSPDTVISIIPFIVGIIIFLNSITKIRQAIELSSAGYNKWWLMLLVALLTASLGALIMFNPFNTVATLVRVIGIIFIIDGIISVISYIFTDTIIHRL